MVEAPHRANRDRRGELETVMPEIIESSILPGVQTVDLTAHGDDRGRFIETFRQEWFPQRPWDRIQTNTSFSKAGVLRGLHYHHRQIDYWFVPVGKVRVGLCDLRRSSPARLKVETFEMGGGAWKGLFIPVGVAHGFYTVTDVVVTYLVDNYYDGTDENGVAWNDPNIGIDWGTRTPELSARDAGNPKLSEIEEAALPE